MSKKKTINLSIPKPCKENWDNMTANEKGRHCANCNKTVIDFSLYSDRELIDFFKSVAGNVCGRLNKYQVNNTILITEQPNRLSWYKLFFGTALASWLGFASNAKAQTKHPPLPVHQQDKKAQSSNDSSKEVHAFISNKESDSIKPLDFIVGNVVPIEPTFHYSGGDLNDYIAKNLVYPKEAIDKGIEGTVYATFVIEKDGSVTGVKLLRGVNSLLDSAAINVIKTMPKWKTADQSGHPVRTQMNMPIKFSLEDANKKTK